MPEHIGIVGCSAAGAALCYQTICIEGDDWQGVADLVLVSAHKLARSGADFLICPHNTIHQAFDHVQARSPLPTLDSTRLLARAALQRAVHGAGRKS